MRFLLMVEMTVSNEDVFEEVSGLLLLSKNEDSHFERRESKVRNLMEDITEFENISCVKWNKSTLQFRDF